MNSKDFSRRFWMKVNKNGKTPTHMPHIGHCWEWNAGYSGNGYGAFSVGSRMDGSRRQEGAHRVAWYLEHGEWPSQNVLHSCDNTRCIRSDHLILGNHGDNMKDRNSKHRTATGGRNGNARLTEDIALEIFRRKLAGEGHRALAKEFKISKTHVSQIGRICWLRLAEEEL